MLIISFLGSLFLLNTLSYLFYKLRQRKKEKSLAINIFKHINNVYFTTFTDSLKNKIQITQIIKNSTWDFLIS